MYGWMDGSIHACIYMRVRVYVCIDVVGFYVHAHMYKKWTQLNRCIHTYSMGLFLETSWIQMVWQLKVCMLANLITSLQLYKTCRIMAACLLLQVDLIFTVMPSKWMLLCSDLQQKQPALLRQIVMLSKNVQCVDLLLSQQERLLTINDVYCYMDISISIKQFCGQYQHEIIW